MDGFLKPDDKLLKRHRRSVFLDNKINLSFNTSSNNPNGGLTKQGNVVNKKILNQDVVYKSIRPVFLFLRAMGVFPYTRIKPGSATFPLIAPAMGYSVLVFILLLIYVIFIAINRITIVRSLEGKFEESVIAYLFLVNILPVFIIPMIWAETGRFTEVLNAWTDFEIIYYKVSGKILPLNLKYTGMLVAICLPLLSSLSVVVTHLTMVDFKVSQVIPYCILDNLTYMMGGYWYMTCQTISHSAGILADDFQTALQHIGPAAMIADYRALWLRLSKLTRDTGTATCITFTFINLYLFFQITLSIYGLLSQISEGFGIKDIGLFVTAVSNICLLFVICDEAHSASQAVRTNFQKKLLMVELSWMNTDAQIEINMFLRATEMNPSAINCGGYFDVNRNLFKSLLTTMVTYLVVLLQFQISIPDDTAAIQGMLNSTAMAASNANASRN